MFEIFYSNFYAVFWLILAILLIIVEASTVALICIWFALGAIASFLVALLHLPFLMQALVFLAVSGIFLLLTKPLAEKMRTKKTPTNSDRYIGKIGKVIQTIDNINTKGQVEVEGQIWTARSRDQTVIEIGTLVEVLEISGVKLIVKKKGE